MTPKEIKEAEERSNWTEAWSSLGFGLMVAAVLLAMMRADWWADVLQAGLLCFILAELRRGR